MLGYAGCCAWGLSSLSFLPFLIWTPLILMGVLLERRILIFARCIGRVRFAPDTSVNYNVQILRVLSDKSHRLDEAVFQFVSWNHRRRLRKMLVRREHPLDEAIFTFLIAHHQRMVSRQFLIERQDPADNPLLRLRGRYHQWRSERSVSVSRFHRVDEYLFGMSNHFRNWKLAWKLNRRRREAENVADHVAVNPNNATGKLRSARQMLQQVFTRHESEPFNGYEMSRIQQMLTWMN
jgi:hypothetical protein